jgi:hypothetical protein
MAHWAHTIEVGRFFTDEAEETMSFEERRDGIVAVLKGQPFYKEDGYGSDDSMEFEFWDAVDDLSMAQTYGDFDSAWHSLYDWADNHRVWIDAVGLVSS